MKVLSFFSAVLVISFFIFNNSFAFKKSSSQEPKLDIVTETKNSVSQLSKNTESQAKVSQTKAFKKGVAGFTNAQKRYLTQKKPYKAKVAKEVLMAEFDKHLDSLDKECNLLSKDKQLERKTKMIQFTNFLTKSLTDPYMDYETALLFEDVLSIMEERDLETSESFNSSYRTFYNIPEEVQDIDNYEHEWAKIIYKNIQCAEKNTKEYVKLKGEIYIS